MLPDAQELWLKLLSVGHDNRVGVMRRLLSTRIILATSWHNQTSMMCMVMMVTLSSQHSSCLCGLLHSQISVKWTEAWMEV